MPYETGQRICCLFLVHTVADLAQPSRLTSDAHSLPDSMCWLLEFGVVVHVVHVARGVPLLLEISFSIGLALWAEFSPLRRPFLLILEHV